MKKQKTLIMLAAAALIVLACVSNIYAADGGDNPASGPAQVSPGQTPAKDRPLKERAYALGERVFGSKEEQEKWKEQYEKKTLNKKGVPKNPISEAAEGAAAATAQYFIVGPIVRLFFQYNIVYPWVIQYGMSFPNNYEEAILSNPSLTDSSAKGYNPEIANAVAFSIRLMLPFYVMAIVLTAAYMIFISASPAGRAKAKSLLKRLVVSMILFSMSPLIIETMLATSYSISSAIISQADPDNVNMVLTGGIWGAYIIFCKLGITDLEIAIAFWTSLYVMAWLPYMVIGMRQIMMTLFCMIFPIGIALYSFVFLRGIGRKILEQTIVWIYLQAFLAVAIVVISLGSSYYYLVPVDANPKLTNIPLPTVMDEGLLTLLEWLPGVNLGASMDPTTVIPGMPVSSWTPPLGMTSILSFSIGAMAYALLVAVPFMMLRLLGKFLP